MVAYTYRYKHKKYFKLKNEKQNNNKKMVGLLEKIILKKCCGSQLWECWLGDTSVVNGRCELSDSVTTPIFAQIIHESSLYSLIPFLLTPILMFSSHLRLGFPTKILRQFLILFIRDYHCGRVQLKCDGTRGRTGRGCEGETGEWSR